MSTKGRQGKESHQRADKKSTTCFWAPSVVFYDTESPVKIDQGSINYNGMIEACFCGETREQAFARGQITTNRTTFVDLLLINAAHVLLSRSSDNIDLLP